MSHQKAGYSGPGKSTLLKLLMRFWDVDSGSMKVDGEDVCQIPTRQLRNLESYVTQETHLFHDSIANNIAIAKPGAIREEIMEAAKKASIHDFIMTLPKGYDTEVGSETTQEARTTGEISTWFDLRTVAQNRCISRPKIMRSNGTLSADLDG